MGANPFQGPIGTKWPEAEAEQNLPPEGVHISDAPDSSRPPNPVRTLTSHAVEDQTDPDTFARCEGEDHRMISIKTNSDQIMYVERCVDCGWVDGMSLNWWAENAIKMQMAARAQRIAVAVESEPFAFVQSSSEELPLEEVLVQALAAAHLLGIRQGLNASDGRRMSSIMRALTAEIARFMQMHRADAATRGVTFLRDIINSPRSMTVEQYCRELRKVIEEKS